MEIPKLKRARLNEIIGLPIEPELKRRLYEAKQKHGFDFSEWLREYIRNNLPKVEKELERGA